MLLKCEANDAFEMDNKTLLLVSLVGNFTNTETRALKTGTQEQHRALTFWALANGSSGPASALGCLA